MPQYPIAPRNASNPFVSRYVDPTARPYLLPPGMSWQQITDRLRENHWRGQIVGPHGAGKSGFLKSLIDHLAEQQPSPRTTLITLHRGDRRLPAGWKQGAPSDDHLLAVDGYEQLSIWKRRRLQHRLRGRGTGLIVTTHRSVGLPLLYRCTPSVAKLQRIVQQMTVGLEWDVSREALAAIYRESQGNLRECLFCLYDLYQSTRTP